MVCAGLQSVVVLEQILFAVRRVDAVPGNAMEIQVYVYAVSTSQLHRAVDLFQTLLVCPIPVVLAAPAPVRQRDAREVEAPLRHYLEIGLREGRLVVGIELVEQIEAFP